MLAMGGPKGRRAAMRGSVGYLSAAFIHLPIKAMVGKSHPRRAALPELGPVTSSFASGPAASDLAFVLGPSQELPLFFVPMSGATMAVHRALVRKGAYYPAWISDLEPVADGLVFGGPPECPERPFCLPGLERALGLRFKELKALDAGGPLSVGALEGNELNGRVSIDGVKPARAATDWLRSRGLVRT